MEADAVEQGTIFRHRRRGCAADPPVQFQRHRDAGAALVEMSGPRVMVCRSVCANRPGCAKIIERGVIAPKLVEPPPRAPSQRRPVQAGRQCPSGNRVVPGGDMRDRPADPVGCDIGIGVGRQQQVAVVGQHGGGSIQREPSRPSGVLRTRQQRYRRPGQRGMASLPSAEHCQGVIGAVVRQHQDRHVSVDGGRRAVDRVEATQDVILLVLRRDGYGDPLPPCVCHATTVFMRCRPLIVPVVVKHDGTAEFHGVA